MFCRNCGKNVGGGNICPNCGTYVQSSSAAPKKKKPVKQTNGMAIAAFICAFFSPLLGWIFGSIGLNNSKECGGAGKGLSHAAIVIAWIGFLLNVLSIFAMMLMM